MPFITDIESGQRVEVSQAYIDMMKDMMEQFRPKTASVKGLIQVHGTMGDYEAEDLSKLFCDPRSFNILEEIVTTRVNQYFSPKQ